MNGRPSIMLGTGMIAIAAPDHSATTKIKTEVNTEVNIEGGAHTLIGARRPLVPTVASSIL